MADLKTTSVHVIRAFEQARDRGYTLGKDYASGIAHRPNYLEPLMVPGDFAYHMPLAVTAYRIMNADPAHPQKMPHDVPQDVIDANYAAFVDGLNLFFPADCLREYLREKLAAPAFAAMTEKERINFARGHSSVDNLPRAYGALSQMPARTRFAQSLEADFRDNGDALYPIDHPARKRTDRKILTHAELLRSYEYSYLHPELHVGFMLWQHYIWSYAKEMEGLLSAAIDSNAPHNGQPQFAGMMASLIHYLPAFQVFLIPHIVELALKRTGLTDVTKLGPVPAEAIKDGIIQAKKNGVFERRFDSEFGTRRSRCPVGHHATRGLIEDMLGAHRAGDVAIVQCLDKIVSERAANRIVGDLCDRIVLRMDEMIHASALAQMDISNSSRSCPHKLKPASRQIIPAGTT